MKTKLSSLQKHAQNKLWSPWSQGDFLEVDQF